jgi:hypothetical protein
VSMWGENTVENDSNNENLKQILVNYYPGNDSDTIPPDSTVLLDKGLSGMFRTMVGASPVINPRSFWNKEDYSIGDTELLAGSVNLMDMDNAETLKTFLTAIRREDWVLTESVICEDVTFYSNNWMGSVEPELLQGNSSAQLMKAIRQWRDAQGDYQLKLHMALTARTMAFATYEVVKMENPEWTLTDLLAGKLPEIPEQKSDLDDIRAEFRKHADTWHKPQTYRFIDGQQETPSAIPPIHLEDRKLQTVYYTFSPDHKIQSIQHILAIAGHHLNPTY